VGIIFGTLGIALPHNTLAVSPQFSLRV